MSKCNVNKVLANKVGYKSIDKTMEVDFNVSTDIDACAKINTRKYLETKSERASYFRSTKPDDKINPCGGFGCKTTGTLMIMTDDQTGEGENPQTTHTASGKFSTISDATDYAAGIMYFYVHVPSAGSYTLNVTLSDLADEAQHDADKYTKTLEASGEGFYPVTIDLAHAPEEVIGAGWTPTQSGAVVNIEAVKTDDSAESIQIGISSISFFDGLDDLVGNISVKLGCLSGIDGDDTIDALEDNCLTAGYDETTTAVERELTFGTWTPNALELNPLLQKADGLDGFMLEHMEKEVASEGDYGVIYIADAYVEECGYVYAALNDDCNVTDSVLKRVNMPNLLDIDERQFQVMNAKTSPSADYVGTKIYVNKSLVGQTLFVSYPKQVEVEERYVATDKNVNSKRVTMTYTRETSDGYAEIHIYHNVLITSFPMTLSNEAGEYTLSLSIQRDGKGDFYEVMIVNKSTQ